jgi:hypothetical protein
MLPPGNIQCSSMIALADSVQSGDVSFMIYDTDNLDKEWFCSGLCETQKVR